MSNQSGETNAQNSTIFDNIGHNLEAQRIRRRTENLARGLINPRDRLYHALFIKIGTFYSLLVPKRFRFLIEVIFLVKGLFLFALLCYLHYSFVGSQLNCLNTTNGSWPRDGLLRVQISTETYADKYVLHGYTAKDGIVSHLCQFDKVLNSNLCSTYDLQSYYLYYDKKHTRVNQCYHFNISDFLYSMTQKLWKDFDSVEIIPESSDSKTLRHREHKMGGSMLLKFSEIFKFENYFSTNADYLFEYSREYGLLHLSLDARRRLKIPVKTIFLDPNNDTCFGSNLNRFLLKYFLGYDNILMNSIKRIADTDNNLGYMVNVMTGENYKFVPSSIGKGSYLISFVLMFLFTIAISMLLRYCHQQVFFFIVNMLQLMNMNALIIFPLAPLMAVILSLVGLETIMAEFFNDTSITFYIILMVWTVDQFDTICCHTVISQKYWLRFFYLYHFVFYAYYYRFNGQFDMLALAASWFMIQHSMLFFFHHYELPMIEESRENNGELESYLEEAVQMIVDGIETVVGDTNTSESQLPQVIDNTAEASSIREVVSETNRSTRVFIFAAERPFVSVVRDFIRHFHRSTGGPLLEHVAVETISDRASETQPMNNQVSDNVNTQDDQPSESQITNNPVNDNTNLLDTRGLSDPVSLVLPDIINDNDMQRSEVETKVTVSEFEVLNTETHMPSNLRIQSNNIADDDSFTHTDILYKQMSFNTTATASNLLSDGSELSNADATLEKNNIDILNEPCSLSRNYISTISNSDMQCTNNINTST